jgi:hypothetical protein
MIRMRYHSGEPGGGQLPPRGAKLAPPADSNLMLVMACHAYQALLLHKQGLVSIKPISHDSIYDVYSRYDAQLQKGEKGA